MLNSEKQQKYNEFQRNLNMLNDDKIANIKEKLIKESSRLSKTTNTNLSLRYKIRKIAEKLTELNDESIIIEGESIIDSLKRYIKIKE